MREEIKIENIRKMDRQMKDMKMIETKVKIDKELLDKIKTYKINIEAFMDTGFRRYVDFIIYKNKLEQYKVDIDAGYFSEELGRNNLEELEKHLEKEETSLLDIDIISTEESYSQKVLMGKILDIMKKLCNESVDETASRFDIILLAELEGIETYLIVDTLDRLKRTGRIYELSPKKYKITEE